MPAFKSIVRALIAGVPALAVNFLLLGLADGFGIVTARGGFQRLTKLWLGPLLTQTDIGGAWADLDLPAPSSVLFMAAFKIGAGLVMALGYCWIAPRLRGPWWRKGLLYALAVWLVNATVILPLLGEGFAGADDLTMTGMVAFALAHTAFFVILAGLSAL